MLSPMPCPIDACNGYAGQYSAKSKVTSGLFGKKNPNDYQCCAGFILQTAAVWI